MSTDRAYNHGKQQESQTPGWTPPLQEQTNLSRDEYNAMIKGQQDQKSNK